MSRQFIRFKHKVCILQFYSIFLFQLHQKAKLILDSLIYFMLNCFIQSTFESVWFDNLLQYNDNDEYNYNRRQTQNINISYMHIHNRYLNTSPTAATLRPNPSAFALDSPPPLVSISDPPYQKSPSQNLDAVRKQKPQPRKPARKQITSIQQNNKQLFTSKPKSRYGLGTQHSKASPSLQRSPEQKDNSIVESQYLNLQQYSSIHKYESISPYYEEQFDEDKEYVKYLGDADGKNKSHVSDIRINLEAEESIVRSRMNKQHANVPQLISIEPRTHHQITPTPNKVNNNLIKIPTMKSDTYTQMLSIESPTRQPQMKKTQSSNKPNSQQVMPIGLARPSTMDAIREKIYMDQENPVDNIIKSGNSGRFMLPLDEIQSYTLNQHKKAVRQQKIGNITRQAYQLLPYPLPSFQNMLSFSSQPLNLSQIQPQWYTQSDTNNSIRLILTRNNKLQEYLKYLAQLEILIQHYKRDKNVEDVCDRRDVIGGKAEQKRDREVTVYYDSDHARNNHGFKSSALADNRQKISSQKQKQSISLSSAKGPINIGSALSEAGHQSIKSRQNNSDYISSLNVFTTNRYRTSTIPQAISQTNQEVQLDNGWGQSSKIKNNRNGNGNGNGNGKNSSVNYNDIGNNSGNMGSSGNKNMLNTLFGNQKTHQVQVMRLLEVLLVKLSAKKCDVKVKPSHHETHGVDDCDTLSSASRLRAQNSKKPYGNKLQQYYIQRGQSPFYLSQKTKRISLQFDEYLPKSASISPKSRKPSTVPTANTIISSQSQKIKQLTQSLQKKDKYLEQIKTQYDHIINNYITTISNLKTKKIEGNLLGLNVNEKNEQQENIVSSRVKKVQIGDEDEYRDHDRKPEEHIQGVRISQPMTFQMSKNGNQSLLDEDHWIGTPGDVENYISNQRRSSPSNN